MNLIKCKCNDASDEPDEPDEMITHDELDEPNEMMGTWWSRWNENVSEIYDPNLMIAP